MSAKYKKPPKPSGTRKKNNRRTAQEADRERARQNAKKAAERKRTASEAKLELKPEAAKKPTPKTENVIAPEKVATIKDATPVEVHARQKQALTVDTTPASPLKVVVVEKPPEQNKLQPVHFNTVDLAASVASAVPALDRLEAAAAAYNHEITARQPVETQESQVVREAHRRPIEQDEHRGAILQTAIRHDTLTRELGLTPEDEFASTLEMNVVSGQAFEITTGQSTMTDEAPPVYDTRDLREDAKPSQIEWIATADRNSRPDEQPAETGDDDPIDRLNTYEELSEEEAALLATFSEQLQTATVEDFHIIGVDETVKAGEPEEAGKATEVNDATGQAEIIPVMKPALETESKTDGAEQTDEIEFTGHAGADNVPENVVRLVELIAEHVSVEDAEDYSETHAILDDVSDSLKLLEAVLVETATSAATLSAALSQLNIVDKNAIEAAEFVESESIQIDQALTLAENADKIAPKLTEPAVVTEAKVALKHTLKKLYEHIGLEYSEEAVDLLIAQLTSPSFSVSFMHSETPGTVDHESREMAVGPEMGQADSSNNDMHESLNWFLARLKQFKKQTNWAHVLGRQALSSFNNLLTMQQVV